MSSCSQYTKLSLANIRSLNTQSLLFCNHYLSLQTNSVLVITETWLSSGALISIPNYTFFSASRPQGGGGGVGIFVSDSLSPSQIGRPYSNIKFEAISVKITNNSGISLCIIGVYRKGSIANDPTFTHEFQQYIDGLNLSCQYVIAGDFNMPDVDWGIMDAVRPMSKEFLEFVALSGLTQHVHHPTHTNGNTLDLLFTSEKSMIFNVEVDTPVSDHLLVTCELEFRITNQNYHKDKSFKSYRLSDYTAIEAELAHVDWDIELTNCPDIDTMYTHFSKIVTDCLNKWTPTIKQAKQKWPRYITKLRDKSRKLYTRYKVSKMQADRDAYKIAESKYKHELHMVIRKKEFGILNSFDLNKFWKYVSAKTLSRKQLGALRNQQGELVVDDSQRAELLNNHFKSVFTVDDNKPFTPDVVLGSSMNSIDFSPVNVYRFLLKVKNKLSYGVDSIPSIALHKLAVVLALPLSIIFTRSIQTCTLPKVWKTSIVTAVFKSGDPCNPTNYRPIALTCTSCRLFETIVTHDIRKYMWQNHIISSNQHGFLDHRSTSSQLIKFQSDLIKNRQGTDVIYLDIAKAFDTVNHRRLLDIMCAYGISREIVNWIKVYLNGRHQMVRVNESVSQPTIVGSGVPQGSVLGPLLFNIYLNDLEKCIQHSKTLMYADDTKFYISRSIPDYLTKLQTDMNSAFDWFSNRQLKISIGKCAVLCTNTGRQKRHNSCYSIGGIQLQQKDHIRDLGVEISSDLKPRIHLLQQARKAGAIMNNMFRAFSFNKKGFMTLFNAKVLPILEYNTECLIDIKKTYWDPVEKIQRKFTKRFCPNLEYDQRLKELDLKPLSLRRTIKDVCTAHKYVYGQVWVDKEDNPIVLYSKESTIQSRSRGNGLKIFSKSTTALEQSFLSHRVCTVWNQLPTSIVCEDNSKIFKTNLTNYLMKNVLKSYTAN